MRRKISCGIDPGREKFGLAVTDDDELLFSAIIPIERLDAIVASLSTGRWSAISIYGQERMISPAELDDIGSHVKDYIIYVGNGTGSDIFQKKLRDAGVRCAPIDETDSTLEGRALYWQLYPPRGFWRLVPTSLRVPPRPVDDLAAWAIVRKVRQLR